MSETVAIWVREALKHSGLSQAELARQLTDRLKRSIDRAAVNKMTLFKLRPRQKRRRVSADEMLAIEEITGFPAPAGYYGDINHVPLIDFVSAGKFGRPASQLPVEDVPLLAFADLGAGDFFATRVSGDSMDRISPEKSVIVINRADKTLVTGKPYVFFGPEGTTYKIWETGPDRLEPYSTNPSNRILFLKKRDEVEVIGRVRRTVLDL